MRTARLAAGFDGVALALFVLIGGASHGIGERLGWFLTVLWPFAVGWFAVAAGVRLYSVPPPAWRRVVLTWAAGLALGLGLRAIVTERESLSTFTIIVYAFVGLEVFGWRAVARLVRWREVLGATGRDPRRG